MSLELDRHVVADAHLSTTGERRTCMPRLSHVIADTRGPGNVQDAQNGRTT